MRQSNFKIEQPTGQYDHRTFTGEIKPYTIRTMGYVQLEILSFSISPISIQHKRFITDNQTTAYLDDDTSFSYASMADQQEPQQDMDEEVEEDVPVGTWSTRSRSRRGQHQVQQAPAPRPELHVVEQPPFQPRKPSRATKNFKSDQAPGARPKSSKTFRRDESLLHVVDQRTIGMKTTLEKTFSGMDQLYEQYEALLREFQEQTERLRELMAPPPPPPRARSPQPGPSHQQETLSTTPMCVL
ncbi:hypothetical protein COOONC_03513 [Cooperia oncophora]